MDWVTGNPPPGSLWPDCAPPCSDAQEGSRLPAHPGLYETLSVRNTVRKTKNARGRRDLPRCGLGRSAPAGAAHAARPRPEDAARQRDPLRSLPDMRNRKVGTERVTATDPGPL